MTNWFIIEPHFSRTSVSNIGIPLGPKMDASDPWIPRGAHFQGISIPCDKADLSFPVKGESVLAQNSGGVYSMRDQFA